MSTFASPHNYGSYGYGYMSGAGTPERYSDLANRYAYRTKSYEPEVEEVASELNSEPVAVARRSLSDSYYTRKCKFLYKKNMYLGLGSGLGPNLLESTILAKISLVI